MCPLVSATFLGLFVSVSEVTSSSLTLPVSSGCSVLDCWRSG